MRKLVFCLVLAGVLFGSDISSSNLFPKHYDSIRAKEMFCKKLSKEADKVYQVKLKNRYTNQELKEIYETCNVDLKTKLYKDLLFFTESRKNIGASTIPFLLTVEILKDLNWF